MQRLAIAGVVVAAVVALGWFTRTPLREVEIATAREGELSVRVVTNGVVEPIDLAQVRAGITGRILQLPDPGTRVERGEVLLRIADAPVRAELATAQSQRLEAQESLDLALRERRRVERRAATDAELHAKGGVTPERHLESQAALEAAQARVEFLSRDVPYLVAALDTRIGELGAQLEAAELRAPFSGTVYRTNAKAGESVALGDLVLWFADLDRLRVRANIDQVDLGAVSTGQLATIRSNAYPGRSWSARVSDLIPHVVKKQARLVAEGLATLDPPTDGLIPGMTVDVEIAVASGPRVLQIPADCLFTDELGSYVLRERDGRVRETRVTVGRSTAARIEVTSGLAPGDSVVRGPLAGLADGARITVRTRDDG